jgi:hypothetical protein
MAIVIDDISVAFSEMARLKRALSTFIANELRPDDAVAIVTTGRGVGQLAQFTSDKAALQDVVSKLQIELWGRHSDDPDDSSANAEDSEGEDGELESMQSGSLAAVQKHHPRDAGPAGAQVGRLRHQRICLRDQGSEPEPALP